ncbi:hypothetical protein JTE90_012852 [Oedothorax gibbosus]|uniref:Uncharacterized protein n=1 Tax=Oedothorax gibbosus TaxID=931172 RepID=A0AAV6TZ22_9ARAC|nr:hypothetical protein JTE90_012852 [Oedothorax gibbosus]
MSLRLCFTTLVLYAVCISNIQAQGYFDDDETVTCGALEFQCDERCLPRSLFCNNIFDCEDKTDENYCSSVSYQSQCPSNWLKCSSQNKCIPENWICNGFKDCSYNNDENSCSPADLARESLDESAPKKNLIKWFLRRRKSGSTTNKWGHELPRTAVALFLGDRDFFVQNKTMEEMSYELSIQLLSRDGHVRKKDLASFIHALLVTCIDPRDFHGKDLVSELRRKVEDSATTTNPFDILALCNAGDKMTEKDVERITAAYNNRSRPFWIDNQAMATIALACIYNTSDFAIDERSLIDMEKDLKKRQFRNGTVENIKTTALVVQVKRNLYVVI